jgi:hypothetical protein
MTFDELRAQMKRHGFNGFTGVHWRNGEPAVVQFPHEGEIRLANASPKQSQPLDKRSVKATEYATV